MNKAQKEALKIRQQENRTGLNKLSAEEKKKVAIQHSFARVSIKPKTKKYYHAGSIR